MAKCYAVRNIGSREIISPWTPIRAQADHWAVECKQHETQPMVEVISAEWTDRDALQAWLGEHRGDQMTPDLAATCPACEGWYPIVGMLGVLTGDLAAADDERYTQADDVLKCVRLREGK
jgi:hypothetical protein